MNIKKIVLIYLYGFLVLDLLMGFLLKYLNLKFFLNPGQIVRGLLLFLLLTVLFYDIQHRISKISKYLILLICFFLIFLSVLFLRLNSLPLLFEELSHISKILFILILIYYVSKHYKFFSYNLEKIVQINFFVFSFSIILGYFTQAGLPTYTYIERTSKGMFYGGNPISILSLVFFTYYLFNFRFKIKNILFVCIGLFNIHIISTKAVFIAPIIFLIYLYDRLIKAKISRKVVIGCTLFPIIFISYLFVAPQVIELYERRYSKLIERSYRAYQKRERVFETTITAPLEMIAYRRAMAAKMQTMFIFENPEFLLLGFGHTGQTDFWIEKEMPYHDAAMDFFDVFFQYGILGSFLIFIIIFKTVFYLIKNMQSDRNSIIILIMFLYSFFAGHVISSATSGTMLALFVGIKWGEMEEFKKNDRKSAIFEWINRKFLWLKK